MNDRYTENTLSGIGSLRVRLSDIPGVKLVQVRKHLSREQIQEAKRFQPHRESSLIREKVVNTMGLAEGSHHFFQKPKITFWAEGC